MRRLRLAVVAVLVVTAAGCSKPFAPATGKVVYADGSPAKELDGFNIVFEGKAPDGRTYSALGAIDTGGRFTMFTTAPGDGAPIGPCRVLIEPKMLDSEREAPYPIDKKYRSFDTSKLTADISAAGPNDFTFTVERKK
jgi:hypothetical protein